MRSAREMNQATGEAEEEISLAGLIMNIHDLDSSSQLIGPNLHPKSGTVTGTDESKLCLVASTSDSPIQPEFQCSGIKQALRMI